MGDFDNYYFKYSFLLFFFIFSYNTLIIFVLVWLGVYPHISWALFIFLHSFSSYYFSDCIISIDLSSNLYILASASLNPMLSLYNKFFYFSHFTFKLYSFHLKILIFNGSIQSEFSFDPFQLFLLYLFIFLFIWYSPLVYLVF